jgi:hypothetical protein
MTTAAQGDPPPVDPPPAPLLLGPVLGILPAHLFQQEVLRRLGPRDLASLAGAGRGCAAAVAATALMQWAKHAKRTAPVYIQPMCVQSAFSHAAHCGNREVLEWLHNTGCPWSSETCQLAAMGGHLEALRWAREHGCLWNEWTRRSVWAPGGAAVGAGAPLPVELGDAGMGRWRRAPGGVAVGSGARLPMGLAHLLLRRLERAA